MSDAISTTEKTLATTQVDISTPAIDREDYREDRLEAVDLLGVGIHALNYTQLCEQIDAWTFSNTAPKFCCYVNPHSIVMSHSDEKFLNATKTADLVMADGAGVIIASKILGLPIQNRVCGPTSMLKVMEYGQDKGFKHYFFGASEQCLEKLNHNLSAKFSDARIVGFESPPYREVSQEENDEMIRRINDSGANILWVGLGAPKQEKWIAENIHKLDVNIVLGVGAAFDFHAGLVKWAPSWVRKIGLEWAYRFVQQPKRLLRRNLNSFVFLSRVFATKFAGSKSPARSSQTSEA